MTPRKTAKKTASPTPVRLARPSPRNGVALPVGAHAGNTGGKPGRSGRKPDEFRQLMRDLLEGPEVLATLAAILRDPHHPHFIAAFKLAAEHGYGRPTQPVELLPSVNVTVVHHVVDPMPEGSEIVPPYSALPPR